MSLGKQAKVISPEMEKGTLSYLSTTRWSLRDTAMFLCSIKAGMRAKEIANLKWYMVQNPDGSVADSIHLENGASKGKNGGRAIPMNKDLKVALQRLSDTERATSHKPNLNVFQSERGGGMDNRTIAKWFLNLYQKLGMHGCSSHSGRRTFITRTARKVSEVGGSLRDIQELAGHSSLQMTQRYIDSNSEAKKKLVDLV
jgi:integrase